MKTKLEQLYPWVDDRSVWRETDDRLHPTVDLAGVGHGAWVVGNGRVFAVRHDEPFTRLSHILGPDYRRDTHFTDWGTQFLVLRHAAQPIEWQWQQAFRVRRTALIGAELHDANVRLLLVDLAPPEWPLILRTIAIQNVGHTVLSDLQLDILHEDIPDGRLLGLDDGWELSRPERILRVQVIAGTPETGDG
ncbi:MAG TPA: hypothetical protein VGL77_15160, partial [Armatimonadota bacterium]